MRTASLTNRLFRNACRLIHPRGNRRRPRLMNLEDRLAPAVFTVNNHLDVNMGSGNVGDLRYCLLAADSNGQDDIINIEFGSAQTIELTQELTINEAKTLTITVPTGKAAVTIDGKDASRIFGINTTSMVTISNLTLTKGYSGAADGGAINVSPLYGNLTVTNCTISKSKTDTTTGQSGGAIAIAKNGNLVITNSTITGNIANKGAGIYFFTGGSAIIEGCTFTLNQQLVSPTGGGGAIYFFGAATAPGFTISNSTIHNNSAEKVGGGIRLRQITGAIPFIIRNSTITGNSAGSQGGGLYVTSQASVGTVEIISSVVSTNINVNSPDIYATTSIIRLNNSALGTKSGFTLDEPNSKNNLIGVDVKLGPLTSNGGPTETRLPGPGSPLRDKGSNPSPQLTTDQRGFTRKLGSEVDIGSVESVDPSPTAVLNPFGPIVSAGPTPNTVTVTYSDSQSNINYTTIGATDIEIIHVKSGTKLTVTGGVPDVAMNGSPRQGIYTFEPLGKSWDASDNGEYQVVLLANEVFDTDSPTPVAAAAGLVGSFSVEIPVTYVVDIVADEDDPNTGPGDLSLREALKLANASVGPMDFIVFDPTVFASNQKIELTLGQLNVTDNVHIIGPGSRVTIDAKSNSRVMNISLPGTGRTVNLANLVIQNGKLTGETGDDLTENGGGLFIGNDNVTMTNCLFQNNTSGANGGAIFSQGPPGVLTIIDSEFKNNATTSTMTKDGIGSGGAIALDGNGSLVMLRTTVSNNSAARHGGGIYFYSGGSLDILSCTISGNMAAGSNGGGGLYFFGTASKLLTIANSTFSGNKATVGPGGGIALQTFRTTSQLSVSNSTIVFNEASFGGGISRVGGDSTIPLTLNSTIVAKNSAFSFFATDISLDFTASNIPGDNNLVGVGDDGGFALGGNNNQAGSSTMPLDPLVDATLAKNGGPTMTHKLLTNSPAIDAGINPVPLSSDQRGGGALRTFDDPGVVNYSGSNGTDIGAVENQKLAPPTVPSILVNGSLAVQRSLVTSIEVTFSEAVYFPSGPNAAFKLERTGFGSLGPVGLNFSPGFGPASVVTITFNNSGLVGIDPGGSLADGTYLLTISADKVLGVGGTLDGDLDGTSEANVIDNVTSAMHRLFGDNDGQGVVTSNDFAEFRKTFGTNINLNFDFNNNGTIDSDDFAEFRKRFGISFLP